MTKVRKLQKENSHLLFGMARTVDGLPDIALGQVGIDVCSLCYLWVGHVNFGFSIWLVIPKSQK